MSKRGFNKDELRKVITTAIDKDGFHDRRVEYTDKYPFGIPVAKVKFVNTGDRGQSVIIPVVDSVRGMMAMWESVPGKGSYTFDNVPISCVLGMTSFPNVRLGTYLKDFSISGDAELDNGTSPFGKIIIHGDCEIVFPTPSTPV